MIYNKFSIEPLRHQACIFCYMAVQFGIMCVHFWYTIATLINLSYNQMTKIYLGVIKQIMNVFAFVQWCDYFHLLKD